MVAQRRALMPVWLFFTLGICSCASLVDSLHDLREWILSKRAQAGLRRGQASRVSLTSQCWFDKIKEGMTGTWRAGEQVLGIGSSYCISAWDVDVRLLHPISQAPPYGVSLQQYQGFGRCLVCQSQIGSYLHSTFAIGQPYKTSTAAFCGASEVAELRSWWCINYS